MSSLRATTSPEWKWASVFQRSCFWETYFAYCFVVLRIGKRRKNRNACHFWNMHNISHSKCSQLLKNKTSSSKSSLLASEKPWKYDRILHLINPLFLLDFIVPNIFIRLCIKGNDRNRTKSEYKSSIFELACLYSRHSI